MTVVNKDREFRFVDLFCGAGGLSCGLEMSGMTCVLGTDQEESAISTFRRNHPKAKTFTGDISKLTKAKLKKMTEGKKIHLVCGGPPCQGMSTAGLGIPDDPRNFLFLEFVRIVEELKPAYVLLENVTGMVGRKNKKILDAIMHMFSKLGYVMSAKVLSAEHYGIPQRRRRTIVVGNRMGYEFKFPSAKFGEKKGMPPYVTVGDAFKKISKNTANHDAESAKIKDIELERIKMVPEGKGIRYHKDEEKYWKEELWLDKDWSEVTENHRLREMRYHRLDRKKVSPTIMTGRYTYYHPTEDRHLTAREAAAIMSFPNEFVFEGTVSQQWRQIGNAVAPLLGRALGEAIYETGKKKKAWRKDIDKRIVKGKAFDYEDDMLDENHAMTDF